MATGGHLEYDRHRPRKPHPKSKHEVDRMTGRWDMAVRNFRNERSVIGRWSVVNRLYAYNDIIIYTLLRYVKRNKKYEKRQEKWVSCDLIPKLLLASQSLYPTLDSRRL